MAPRGRGKFSKPSRGGGKHFSRDVQPVDKDGNPVGLWREPGDDIPSSGEEDESEEASGSEEESSDEDDAQAGPSTVAGSSAGPAAMTREERRAAAKAKKLAAIARRNNVAAQPGDLPPSDSEEDESDDGDDDEEDLPANPNHTAKSRSQLHKDPAAAPEKAAGGDLSQLSRREREAIEAQQARERYMKLHAEGKTEEARADLARLALIREQREAERLRKQAEKEEKEALLREKAAAREREMKRREETKGKKKGGSKKN
ncbi:PDGFA associated 1 family protein [Aspergillus fischeri NRRL 181]|uniref:Casein kinase substrate phosphoprotein PP28 domain-containing protein n=1 Tax=Neosartorya fischeri (strain ATCC 1020 / DSM 3700 / CBS 544.65 / FGSC A1164 / JCM 1740 / NRRL 181 / WB 181) TaxID=331117 RepID=A1D8D7_NEOFI|nr:conserved hypothetical protein [Aspergillus fischeri NRRL 181]EAW21981.1 conserved hypothetical protein [Aspergillus fischeri NRRL 181]KAG2007822.1 hypothetical protein GB937_008180 [Aspergillus fischeri]